jgi:hypothetical protein
LAAEIAEGLAIRLETLVDSWISEQLIAPTTAGRMTAFSTGSRPDPSRDE